MYYWRKKWIKKIKKVEVSSYDFCQIVPEVNYMHLFKKFHDIPSQKECRNKPFWICEKDCEVKIYFKSGLEFVYKIKAGYVTDFASIPSFARGFINENDSKIIIAALIHDINFGLKFQTFDFSNTLFRMMMKYYKMGVIKRNIAYNSVKWFGKSHYGGTQKQINKRREYIQFDDYLKDEL